MERETFPGLLAEGAHLQGMVDSTYWLDLGTPQAFVRGSADLVLGRAPSPAVPGRCGDRLVLATATVAPDAKLTGGTVVGHGAVVGEGARITGSTILADAVIEPGAVITDSLVGAGARIGARTILAGAVVGDGARVGADNELRHGVQGVVRRRAPGGRGPLLLGPVALCPAGPEPVVRRTSGVLARFQATSAREARPGSGGGPRHSGTPAGKGPRTLEGWQDDSPPAPAAAPASPHRARRHSRGRGPRARAPSTSPSPWRPSGAAPPTPPSAPPPTARYGEPRAPRPGPPPCG